MRKGIITKEMTVWCAECETWESADSTDFIATIRGGGWRRTKERGWLCPHCVDARKRSASKANAVTCPTVNGHL